MASPNTATNWETNVQTHEPMETSLIQMTAVTLPVKGRSGNAWYLFPFMSLSAVDTCRGVGLESFLVLGDCTRKGTAAQATKHKEACVSH